MKRKPIHYSDDELTFIEANKQLTRKVLYQLFCDRFNRNDISQDNLTSLCKRNGWLTGRTGRYEKGNIPHPDARMKGPNKTSFKKGQRPHNWKPIGSTRVTVDGYVEVKTHEPNKWGQLHVVTWCEHHGAVPDGSIVSFIDGNKQNCCITNLELISRNENLQINRLRCSSEPKELQPVIRTIGKLMAKTSECENRLTK